MPSPLCKTEGIATRIAPYSETSCVVTWMTRDHGRLATVMKGAYRPRSAWLGEFALLDTSELIFYRSPNSGSAHVGRSCALLCDRRIFKSDWRAAAAGLYLADLITRFFPPDTGSAEGYPILEELLHRLDEGVSIRLLMRLEFELLQRMGHAPRLNACVGCHVPLVPGLAAARFAPVRGGLQCMRCSRTDPSSLESAPPDALIELQGWEQSSEPRLAERSELHPLTLEPIKRFMGQFLEHHMDAPPRGRQAAMESIAWKSPPLSTPVGLC